MLYVPQPLPDQVRHRCRNPRCAGKLKTPTADPRDAFCCTGCFQGFYRTRCLVCERSFERNTERQRLCGRPKCKREFKRDSARFSGTRYLGSVSAPNTSRNPLKTGLKTGSKTGRPWRKVAGPDVHPINLAIPLDADLAARLRRKVEADFEPLRKAKRRADRTALIKRKHPPANMLGGFRFPDALEIDLDPPPVALHPIAPPPSDDPLTVPGFLERIRFAELEAAL